MRARLRRAEIVRVKNSGVAQKRKHALFAFFLFLNLLVVVPYLRERNVRALRKEFYRVAEVERFHLHYKLKNVPALMTAEAIVKLFRGVNAKGRRFFVMEGTPSPKIVAALLQLNVPRNGVYQIVFSLDLVKKFRVVTSHCSPNKL